jgi:hypothetical protein
MATEFAKWQCRATNQAVRLSPDASGAEGVVTQQAGLVAAEFACFRINTPVFLEEGGVAGDPCIREVTSSRCFLSYTYHIQMYAGHHRGSQQFSSPCLSKGNALQMELHAKAI